jgi:hypothetical protein
LLRHKDSKLLGGGNNFLVTWPQAKAGKRLAALDFFLAAHFQLRKGD